VGGALARVALTAFLRTAAEIAERGTFTGFADLVPSPELSARFPAP